ncbi:alpha/beta fold hydrolase [Marinobacter sp.]|uniref:alpha/beta fold hydrolase n=1 Tax=Marinobacter sp. TaxID=50741 RepID=UPI0034A2760E
MSHDTNNRTFTGKQSKLSGMTWGSRSDPLWIAMHGWMDNAASFSRIAPIIANELGVRIIAIDFSGHGHSRHRPPGSEYSMWSYCHDVLDVLDELGNPKVTLLGHSLGAGVANLMAATYPEFVRGIVLIDGLLGRLVEPEHLVDQLRSGVSAQRKEYLHEKQYQDIDEAIEARVRKSLLPITADAVRPIVIRSLAGDTQNGYRLRIDRQITAPRPVAFSTDQAVAILDNIQCPSLLIEGDRGIIHERDPSHACRKAIKGLTQIKLEGGHHLHIDANSMMPVAGEIIAWTKKTPTLLRK